METMIDLKKLFKKLQTDAKSALFTEETMHDKVLKRLKSQDTIKTLNL